MKEVVTINTRCVRVRVWFHDSKIQALLGQNGNCQSNLRYRINELLNADSKKIWRYLRNRFALSHCSYPFCSNRCWWPQSLWARVSTLQLAAVKAAGILLLVIFLLVVVTTYHALEAVSWYFECHPVRISISLTSRTLLLDHHYHLHRSYPSYRNTEFKSRIVARTNVPNLFLILSIVVVIYLWHQQLLFMCLHAFEDLLPIEVLLVAIL